ncbi:MAG TPA: deoxyguanosinetriphosphate triphosphohydrolase [Actinomycetes bacterium]|nr:deoxyguanosinetriphosphate triphosphohydrolase [Actinomycetes bacterium]
MADTSSVSGCALRYDDAARARWASEPGKRPGRTPFERDRARVLHSAALRRLASKTLVVLAGEHDFLRTRLTHTLEVAQIGRELAKALGADPDLVDAACLAHDLGHPPFGHNGEAALAGLADGCGGFEGNAQTLRVLTRLEAKTFDASGRSVGLNLTRAALDAATKYPWTRAHRADKFGVYDDDLEVFRWARDGAPEGRRCLEAQVMDWADDVAYSVHDVEDAVHAGRLRFEALHDPDERAALLALTATRFPEARTDELGAALDRLLALPVWPTSYDGSLPALAALKDLTSQLIGRFAVAAEEATRASYGDRPLTRYDADLVVPRPVRLECEVLKAVADRYVMQPRMAHGAYDDERRVVVELVQALLERAPHALEPWLRPAWAAAADDAARRRVVIDQVASYTDTSAIAAHRRLVRGIG